MAATLYRSVTCNVLVTDPVGQRAGTVNKAWGHADVLKLNEAQHEAPHIAALAGAKWYQPGGSVGQNLPIIWRDSVFRKLDQGVVTVYVGGKGDGPSRGCTWVLLEHRASKKRVLEFNMHEIHKAWTTQTHRQPIWNDILQGVSAEVNRVMGRYPGIPVVISGDMNKASGIDFPGLAEREVTGTPATYGGSRYDRFFLVGGITAKSWLEIHTNSDHDSLMVNLEVTAASETPGSATIPPSPAVAGGSTPAPPGQKPLPQIAEARRSTLTFRARQKWRFFATRVTGDDTSDVILHPDLPLTDAEIEDNLTGHNGLTGTLSPKLASLVAADGRPLLEEWGSAIWAEESGNIHGGGIVTHSTFDGSSWGVTCTGLTGYAASLPYAGSTFFVETEVADIFRHIWTHIQSQPGGNVGLELGPLTTGIKIGTALEQVEFDSQSGPVSFEAGPYKLAWYQDHDLGENLASLAADYGFDWHEEHYWDGDNLRHYLRLGFPKIGRRRTDLRFVVGENVHVLPSVERDGDEYADETWVLGSGEGSAMVRGTARRNIKRLRRVAVVADPSLRTQKSVNAAAEREMAWRVDLDNITDLQVRAHPHADIGAVNVGDEIHIQGPTGWVDIDAWYRVLSRRIKPFDATRMTLSVVRSDRTVA